MDQKQAQKMNVNLTEEDILLCKCGHDSFVQTTKLGKVSSVYTGTGKPGVIPMPKGFECSKCGEVLPGDAKTKGEVEKSDKIKPGTQMSLFEGDGTGDTK